MKYKWHLLAWIYHATVTPSRPVTTIMYVTGILAYVSGYVLMGLSGNFNNNYSGILC